MVFKVFKYFWRIMNGPSLIKITKKVKQWPKLSYRMHDEQVYNAINRQRGSLINCQFLSLGQMHLSHHSRDTYIMSNVPSGRKLFKTKRRRLLKLRNHNQIQVRPVNLAPFVFKDWRKQSKDQRLSKQVYRSLSSQQQISVQVFHWQFYNAVAEVTKNLLSCLGLKARGGSQCSGYILKWKAHCFKNKTESKTNIHFPKFKTVKTCFELI